MVSVPSRDLREDLVGSMPIRRHSEERGPGARTIVVARATGRRGLPPFCSMKEGDAGRLERPLKLLHGVEPDGESAAFKLQPLHGGN
jgi:hypothetical protein